MHEAVGFAAYLLSSMGLTVLVVWPQEGPSAWLRDRILRSLLPTSVQKVLDCYICLSFWSALALAPWFWLVYREPWCWTGPLITPLLFWFIYRDES